MLYFIFYRERANQEGNTDQPYLTKRSLYADKLEVYQETAGKRISLRETAETYHL